MDETTVLDNVLQQAHVVHAGSVNGGGVVGEIRVDLSDLVESARLRTAMAVESLPGFNCMCLGDVRFEVFDRTGERLAVVVLHHGATLRWEAWESDAVLADGRLLLAWLDGHGMPGPLLQFEADRLREQEWTVEERNWQAAMPAGLEGLADRILGLSRTGGSPAPELLAELTDRLHLIFPDPVERVLALLGWYGSGSGRCSGFPVHEGVPGELLGRVPIADLLAALADPRAEHEAAHRPVEVQPAQNGGAVLAPQVTNCAASSRVHFGPRLWSGSLQHTRSTGLDATFSWGLTHILN